MHASLVKLIKSDNRASLKHESLFALTRSKKCLQIRASAFGNSAAYSQSLPEMI